MDTGLAMEGGTVGHRTRDGRWDRWTHLILCKVASYVHKPVCKFNTKNKRLKNE